MTRFNSNCRRGLRLGYGDVYASWSQVVFCVIVLVALIGTTIDLLTKCYVLRFTERLLAWMSHKDMATLVVIFIAFGAISIVALLPQTFLFLGAGYLCSSRIENDLLAFLTGLCLSMVTFVLGATIAFLLSRKVLPPSCTRKVFRKISVLNGLDHALRHSGRRIIILLRVNPLMPYNALNYGLGLTSCSLGDYLVGMVGAVPFTCVAVYAGMIISGIQYLNTMFAHTDALWYCIYVAFGVVCIASCVAIVRYTAAEMKAAVADAPLERDGPGGRRQTGTEFDLDDEDEFGRLEDDNSTLFGTFVSREANAAGGGSRTRDEEMRPIGGSEGEEVSTVPLLAAAAAAAAAAEEGEAGVSVGVKMGVRNGGGNDRNGSVVNV